MEQDKKDLYQKKLGGGFHFLWEYRIEILAGLLMIVGIILTFTGFFHSGGGLVGLGVGLCFYKEIHGYFVQLKDIYVEQGIFKTLMLIGMVIYFLITIPAFIIGVAIGFGAMYLITRFFPAEKPPRV